MTETPPGLPACWTDILASVQQTLAQAEAAAERSAAQLAQGDPAPAAAPPWVAQLTALDEPFRRLAACSAGADLLAAEVGAALQASEDALRQWLAQVRPAGRTVVKEASAGV